MIRWGIWALCGALVAGPGAAKIRLVEAGIMCPELRETTDRIEAPDTETGFIDIVDGNTEFDLPDRQVPTLQHLSFGLRVALKAGEGATDFRMIVEHPPIGAEGVTRESWPDTLVPGEESLNFYTFDFPYEMVPGDWVFSIEVDGQAQVTVPFVVGGPGSNPRVDAVCLGALNS